MPINSPQKIQSWLKMMSNAFANQSAKVIKVGKMCFHLPIILNLLGPESTWKNDI